LPLTWVESGSAQAIRENRFIWQGAGSIDFASDDTVYLEAEVHAEVIVPVEHFGVQIYLRNVTDSVSQFYFFIPGNPFGRPRTYQRAKWYDPENAANTFVGSADKVVEWWYYMNMAQPTGASVNIMGINLYLGRDD
jgi:hypothetical protein